MREGGMSEKGTLIMIHFLLLVLQIIAVGLAIGLDSKWSALSVPIGAAQTFFPNPFKLTT